MLKKKLKMKIFVGRMGSIPLLLQVERKYTIVFLFVVVFIIVIRLLGEKKHMIQNNG